MEAAPKMKHEQEHSAQAICMSWELRPSVIYHCCPCTHPASYSYGRMRNPLCPDNKKRKMKICKLRTWPQFKNGYHLQDSFTQGWPGRTAKKEQASQLGTPLRSVPRVHCVEREMAQEQ